MFEGAPVDFGLVGDSPQIQRVLRFIEKLRANRSPVLLEGESGTGKELVARALHEVSPGASRVFVAVNVAALPPTLLESELFGHARGAFTGASESKRGLIEQAHGGTLFLDEIGEFPLEMQAKLLRVLEEMVVRPIGSSRTMQLDVRVIAATNRNLASDAEKGGFRPDLFYRLNVISLRLPALRERPGDIPLLIDHFLERYGGRRIKIKPPVLECLLRYDWPGNVRQLENCIHRIVALASAEEVDLRHLPTQVRNAIEACKDSHRGRVMPLSELEKIAIEDAMRVAGGNRLVAARLLGIGKTTLYRKLKQYNHRPRVKAAVWAEK